jgi:hypothetical protein
MKEEANNASIAIIALGLAVSILSSSQLIITPADAKQNPREKLKYCFDQSLPESPGLTGRTCTRTQPQCEEARERSFLSPHDEPTSECYKLEEKGI